LLVVSFYTVGHDRVHQKIDTVKLQQIVLKSNNLSNFEGIHYILHYIHTIDQRRKVLYLRPGRLR
jgi:hypothetical protein